MKKMVIARLFIKNEARSTFLKEATVLIQRTRAEKGCLFYSLYEDAARPGDFLFYEEYADQEALDEHFHSAHLQVFRDITGYMHAKDRIVEVI